MPGSSSISTLNKKFGEHNTPITTSLIACSKVEPLSLDSLASSNKRFNSLSVTDRLNAREVNLEIICLNAAPSLMPFLPGSVTKILR